MGRSAWVGQMHRWVSMVFTLSAVAVVIILLVQDDPAEWVYLSPLLPLALLLLSGLYLLVLPYLSRRRGGRGVLREP